MRIRIYLPGILFYTLFFTSGFACSILYYVDPVTGKIYGLNNEDYFYDVKPYIQVEPAHKNKQARLWYGWNDFAQGGINQSGLFFDGATTPEEPSIPGYTSPSGNLGDEILSACSTVQEAVDYLHQHKIALTNGHLLFGDLQGHALIVEWVNGEQHIISMQGHTLMMTNFLLSDTSRGNYPCYRYQALQTEIDTLAKSTDTLSFKRIANIIGKAVQPAVKNAEGKEGGTLYSTFINITDLQFILVYKLDNTKITRLDLKKEWSTGKKRKIWLE